MFWMTHRNDLTFEMGRMKVHNLQIQLDTSVVYLSTTICTIVLVKKKHLKM